MGTNSTHLSKTIMWGVQLSIIQCPPSNRQARTVPTRCSTSGWLHCIRSRPVSAMKYLKIQNHMVLRSISWIFKIKLFIPGYTKSVFPSRTFAQRFLTWCFMIGLMKALIFRINGKLSYMSKKIDFKTF